MIISKEVAAPPQKTTGQYGFRTCIMPTQAGNLCFHFQKDFHFHRALYEDDLNYNLNKGAFKLLYHPDFLIIHVCPVVGFK